MQPSLLKKSYLMTYYSKMTPKHSDIIDRQEVPASHYNYDFTVRKNGTGQSRKEWGDSDRVISRVTHVSLYEILRRIAVLWKTRAPTSSQHMLTDG